MQLLWNDVGITNHERCLTRSFGKWREEPIALYLFELKEANRWSFQCKCKPPRYQATYFWRNHVPSFPSIHLPSSATFVVWTHELCSHGKWHTSSQWATIDHDILDAIMPGRLLEHGKLTLNWQQVDSVLRWLAKWKPSFGRWRFWLFGPGGCWRSTDLPTCFWYRRWSSPLSSPNQ